MKENIEFKQVREFDGIVSGTLLFIKQNIKALLKTFFSFCGIFILGGMISTILFQFQMGYAFSSGDTFSIWRNIFGLQYLLIIVFSILNYTAMYTAVLSFIALYIAKGNVAPTLQETWNYFKYYFFRVMWSGILVYIIWAICAALCLVPGIYVTPAFSIFFAIVIFENADFGFSFSRGFALVKDNWWITFATLLVVGVITFVCMMIVQLPALILTMVSTIAGENFKMMQGYEIFTSISQYVSQVFIIIPLVTAAFIYHNLVERKESSGLMKRIDDFGTNQPVNSHPEEEY